MSDRTATIQELVEELTARNHDCRKYRRDLADARAIARELLDAWDCRRETTRLTIRQRVDWLDE